MGVARKSGYRWRSEMGGVIVKKPAVSSGRYLSLFERQRIASWHDRGASVRDIARRVGRSSSTVSRELRRNRLDWDDGCEPVLAYLRARERAKRPKTGKIAGSPWLAKTSQAKAGAALESGADPPPSEGPAREGISLRVGCGRGRGL